MFDPAITFIADLLIYVLFLGLLVLWLIDNRIKREQVLHAISAVVVALLIAYLIKDFFPTKRPYVYEGIVPITLTIPHDSSFPSSHTAAAFALAMSIYLHERKIGIVFLLEATLVGISRVVADVHYPIDIVAGAVIGMFVAVLVSKSHLFGLLPRKK